MAVHDNERAAAPGEQKHPTWRARQGDPFDGTTWLAACTGEANEASDQARHDLARYYVEVWAPLMAYPYENDMHRSRVTDMERTVAASHAPCMQRADMVRRRCRCRR